MRGVIEAKEPWRENVCAGRWIEDGDGRDPGNVRAKVGEISQQSRSRENRDKTRLAAFDHRREPAQSGHDLGESEAPRFRRYFYSRIKVRHRFFQRGTITEGGG